MQIVDQFRKARAELAIQGITAQEISFDSRGLHITLTDGDVAKMNAVANELARRLRAKSRHWIQKTKVG